MGLPQSFALRAAVALDLRPRPGQRGCPRPFGNRGQGLHPLEPNKRIAGSEPQWNGPLTKPACEGEAPSTQDPRAEAQEQQHHVQTPLATHSHDLVRNRASSSPRLVPDDGSVAPVIARARAMLRGINARSAYGKIPKTTDLTSPPSAPRSVSIRGSRGMAIPPWRFQGPPVALGRVQGGAPAKPF